MLNPIRLVGIKSTYFFLKIVVYFQKECIFALAKCNGLVVQLVRIPACHAGGREFESRPDRKSTSFDEVLFFFKKNFFLVRLFALLLYI